MSREDEIVSPRPAGHLADCRAAPETSEFRSPLEGFRGVQGQSGRSKNQRSPRRNTKPTRDKSAQSCRMKAHRASATADTLAAEESYQNDVAVMPQNGSCSLRSGMKDRKQGPALGHSPAEALRCALFEQDVSPQSRCTVQSFTTFCAMR